MEHRAKIVGIALLCFAFGSEALTLGRARGAVLVGQPLDMVVPVQMDAGEEASSLCFDAEVFHADTRQDASRVRVVVEAATQAQTANVRILSSALIDEPVVTVYLRTGCGQKTTRRYILLADLPSEVEAPPAPLVIPTSAPVPAPATLDMTPAAAVSTVKAKTVRVAKQTVPAKVGDKRPSVKAAAVSPGRAMADEKSKVGRSAARPRLKLDPLELLSDRVANLDSYMTFEPAEDALRTLQKMQALEADVKALRAAATTHEASLLDLKARLQKAETERFPVGLIYGLIALVVACLAALAFLWNTQRRVQVGSNDWWSASIATPGPPEPEIGPAPGPVKAGREPDRAAASEQARTATVSGSLHDSGSSSEVDVRLIEMSESNFDNLMQTGTAHSAVRKQPPARQVHSLNSEAVFDIRQQAEFFVSLGQTDRAVRILKKQIHESDEPNPFVYLDLLSLFHSLSLKHDFQQLREDFNLLFNGRVPEFAFFKDEGRGLESYPDVLSRITALWPTPKALEVIEACIFQDPRHAKHQSFDLAAFRDLLLLHTLAQSIVLAPHPAATPSSDPGRTASVRPEVPLAEIALPRALDLDLSDSETEGVASHPLAAAEVDVPLPIPLLMPGDHEVDVPGDNATRPLDSVNLVDFDLPDAPKPPGH